MEQLFVVMSECLLALTFVTITHNGVATNREMTYVNI